MRAPAKKIAIIGFGLEGQALFFYLRKKGEKNITILDQNPTIKIPQGVKAVLGKNYLKNLSDFDSIYKSQGIPYLPEIGKVKNKVSSLAKIFFDNAKGTILGITGSAGKTTTTALIYKILKASRKNIFLGGNIGKNPLGFLPKLNKNSLTVMELSSFQLLGLKKSPHIAVVLDVFEEHLDKHKNFKEYLDAKTNIARYQKPEDIIIFSKGNRYSEKIASMSPAKKLSFSLADHTADMYVRNGVIVSKKDGKIADVREIKLPGSHSIKNVMAATLAARAIGAPPGVIQKVIRSFRGLPHRLEFVAKIKGVTFYNDAGAVNISAALASMDTFPENKVVIVGGQNKNLPLTPLARRLAKSDVAFAVLFGKMRNDLAQLLKKTGAKNFAVKTKMIEAAKLAAKKAEPGDIVLLTPGTASFDEFKDYRERGEAFKKFVKSLK